MIRHDIHTLDKASRQADGPRPRRRRRAILRPSASRELLLTGALLTLTCISPLAVGAADEEAKPAPGARTASGGEATPNAAGADDSGKPSVADDPGYRAAMREYLLIQGTPETASQGVAYGVANETLVAIAQTGTEVTEPMQKIVLEQALETFSRKFGDIEYLTDLYAPIYAEHFSEAEIREMIDFFESPVGRKSLELLIPINEASMAAIRDAAFALTPAFQLAVDAKLREAGIEVTP